MKKIIMLLCSLIILSSFAACNNGDSASSDNENEGQKYEINANIDVTNAKGKLALDQKTVKDILSAYSDDVLGLSASVYDYRFKLSQVRVGDEVGCKAEAIIGDDGRGEALFVITDGACYKYNAEKEKYQRLTETGTEKADVEIIDESEKTTQKNKTDESSAPFKTDEEVQSENDIVLQKRYANYNLKKAVGLPKDISKYTFQVTGNQAKAEDGENVYVIYLLENGEYTEYKFAIGNGKDYYYDTKAETYKVLS